MSISYPIGWDEANTRDGTNRLTLRMQTRIVDLYWKNIIIFPKEIRPRTKKTNMVFLRIILFECDNRKYKKINRTEYENRVSRNQCTV